MTALHTSLISGVAVALALASTGCPNDVQDTDDGSSTGGTSTGGPGATEPTGGPTTTDGPTSTASTTDGSSTGPGDVTTDSTATTVDPTTEAVTTHDTTGTTLDTTGTTLDTTGDTTGDTTTGTTDDTTSDTSTTAAEEFVQVQLIAFNDLHGNLEPPTGSNGRIRLPDNSQVDAGGAAYLATHVEALRATNPNTVVVSAGDLIGASPLVSALFHDEPTIEVMNQIGLAYNAVGNHEFDDGRAELLRMQYGGCHPQDGCLDDTPFPGADFQFLAANVLISVDPVETLFPSYAVQQVGGVEVAFIGMTLEATPEIVTPTGVVGLTFVDEVERANALVPELQAMGVEAIVVLVHEGGFQSGYFDECPGISGPIVDIATGLSDAVDVVVSGHTHQAYNCIIADKVVTSGASFGRVLTDIDLEVSTLTGDVTAVTAKNIVVTRDAADPEIESFVSTYKTLVAPLANKPIGQITATLARFPPMNSNGLSQMGLVLADAHLAATADPMFGGAQVAFMNIGGVRADLLYPKAPGEAVDGIVTYGEGFAVQPFGNSLVVMTLTGAQIEALLEQQFAPGVQDNVLQVSEGFTYAYSASAPVGAKVDPASIFLNGVPVDPAQDYRVAVISYLAAGGDSFSVLVDGTDRLGGVTDMEALETYFAEASPISPPALDRVTKLP